ncbi:MAG: DNA-binding protein [Steroidobacteraceae bacterium]
MWSRLAIMASPEGSAPAPPDIAPLIRIVRGQRVLLDSSLAALYGVTTKVLNQAVRRNIERFPRDFLIQLTDSEVQSSRSQFVTLNKGRGYNVKYLPLAFTEHGAIMAASILNSPRAVQMSVYIVRAFVQLRQMLASNAQLARKLDALERSVAILDADTRKQFDQVYEAILGLMGSGPRKSQ